MHSMSSDFVIRPQELLNADGQSKCIVALKYFTLYQCSIVSCVKEVE